MSGRATTSLSLILSLCFTVLGVLGCSEAGETNGSPSLDPDLDNADHDQLQRDILEDRVVTGDEYERAVLALISCLRGAGVQVTDPTPAPGGIYRYLYTSGSQDPRRVDQLYLQCYQRTLAAVERAWAEAHAPSEQELSDARNCTRQVLARCGGNRSRESESRGLRAAPADFVSVLAML